MDNIRLFSSKGDSTDSASDGLSLNARVLISESHRSLVAPCNIHNKYFLQLGQQLIKLLSRCIQRFAFFFELLQSLSSAFRRPSRILIIAAEVHLFQGVLQYYRQPIRRGNSTFDLSLLCRYRLLNLFCDMAVVDRAVPVRMLAHPLHCMARTGATHKVAMLTRVLMVTLQF